MQDLLERLAKLRERDPLCQLFGAESHRYAVEPTTWDEVARFEDRYGARLPDPFRRFLLEVTDGGAGPGHGLVSLDRTDDDDVAENLALLGQPFDHEEYFGLQPPDQDPDEQHEEDVEEALKVYWRDMPGTMTLCHYGCCIRAQLVVTGAMAGLVLLDQRSDEAGVYPFTRATAGRWNAYERPPNQDRTPLEMVPWYRDWLDASLALLEVARPPVPS